MGRPVGEAETEEATGTETEGGGIIVATLSLSLYFFLPNDLRTLAEGVHRFSDGMKEFRGGLGPYVRSSLELGTLQYLQKIRSRFISCFTPLSPAIDQANEHVDPGK